MKIFSVRELIVETTCIMVTILEVIVRLAVYHTDCSNDNLPLSAEHREYLEKGGRHNNVKARDVDSRNEPDTFVKFRSHLHSRA